MTMKLLSEQHFVFLSLIGGCTSSSESTVVKMSHCWKFHVVAQLIYCNCLHTSDTKLKLGVASGRKNGPAKVSMYLQDLISCKAILYKNIHQFIYTTKPHAYFELSTSKMCCESVNALARQ